MYIPIHLGRGNLAYQYDMRNTPLSSTEAEKDLGLNVTRLPVKVKFMLIIADRLKPHSPYSLGEWSCLVAAVPPHPQWPSAALQSLGSWSGEDAGHGGTSGPGPD